MRIIPRRTPAHYVMVGMQGRGESGAIVSPEVICNAVNDALRSTGVEVSKTPLTPHRLLEEIERARQHAAPKREAA